MSLVLFGVGQRGKARNYPQVGLLNHGGDYFDLRVDRGKFVSGVSDERRQAFIDGSEECLVAQDIRRTSTRGGGQVSGLETWNRRAIGAE